MTLPQLQLATQCLATHSFHPGTTRNHLQSASTYINFCDNCHLPFINPPLSIITCYITYLTQKFCSHSVRSYVSRVRFFHKELGLIPDFLDSFPIATLLRAADITMWVPSTPPPPPCLPVLPPLLHQLGQLSSSLGALGPSTRVCLTFGFFGMLCQSILAPATPTQFDKSRHTCCGDVIQVPSQALSSSSSGPKHTRPWPHHQFYPFQWYLAILQIQRMLIINSSPHPLLLLITPSFLTSMGPNWS